VDVHIPDGCMVVLIGTSGSGKSTLARRHFLPTEIVSSDACRGLVADDPRARDADADAFRLVHLLVATRLRRGRTTVVDATNVQPRSRRTLVATAGRYSRPAIAVVLDLPSTVCEQRDRDRGDDAVGADVVRAQRRLLDRGLATLDTEGFAEVVVLRTPAEVEALSRR